MTPTKIEIAAPQEKVPLELRYQNICVYDLETKFLASEIGGWKNLDKMGISVGTIYDYRDGDYKVYLEDNLKELTERLKTAALIVGFNIKGFDNMLLRACGFDLPEDGKLPIYDLLYETRLALGWKPDDEYSSYPKGTKLDDHLAATFSNSFKKTEKGEDAPGLFKRSEWGRLITYNIGDVRREKCLFEMAWLKGGWTLPTHGQIKVRPPQSFLP